MSVDNCAECNGTGFAGFSSCLACAGRNYSAKTAAKKAEAAMTTAASKSGRVTVGWVIKHFGYYRGAGRWNEKRSDAAIYATHAEALAAKPRNSRIVRLTRPAPAAAPSAVAGDTLKERARVAYEAWISSSDKRRDIDMMIDFARAEVARAREEQRAEDVAICERGVKMNGGPDRWEDARASAMRQMATAIRRGGTAAAPRHPLPTAPSSGSWLRDLDAIVEMGASSVDIVTAAGAVVEMMDAQREADARAVLRLKKEWDSSVHDVIAAAAAAIRSRAPAAPVPGRAKHRLGRATRDPMKHVWIREDPKTRGPEPRDPGEGSGPR